MHFFATGLPAPRAEVLAFYAREAEQRAAEDAETANRAAGERARAESELRREFRLRTQALLQVHVAFFFSILFDSNLLRRRLFLLLLIFASGDDISVASPSRSSPATSVSSGRSSGGGGDARRDLHGCIFMLSFCLSL